MNKPLASWSASTAEILQHLQTATAGPASAEHKERLVRYGSNLLKAPKQSDVFTLLLAQFEWQRAERQSPATAGIEHIQLTGHCDCSLDQSKK